MRALKFLEELRRVQQSHESQRGMTARGKAELNDAQKLAYDIATDWFSRVLDGENIAPMRMVITGVGGAGKSDVLRAIRSEFVNMIRANGVVRHERAGCRLPGRRAGL